MTTIGRPIPPVVFIGPACAGKSTLAAILADRLGRPRASLDDLVRDYCAEAGYSPADFRKLRGSARPALFTGAVERIVAEYPGHIVDLGAGHTDIQEPVLFGRLQRALAPCPHVILVLPSADPEEAVRILRERSRALRGHDWVRHGVDHIERWIKHSPNERLATITIYTGEETPAATCDRLLAQL
jgi:hypothetical protein